MWIGVLALGIWQALAAQPSSRLTLELADYVPMPITGDVDGQNTMGQLARVNFLRDEPGGRRQSSSFWSCGWRGAMRRPEQLDPERSAPRAR